MIGIEGLVNQVSKQYRKVGEERKKVEENLHLTSLPSEKIIRACQ